MGIRILHCDDMYLSYKCFLILAFAPRRMAVSCVAARPSVCTENPVPPFLRWDLWTYRESLPRLRRDIANRGERVIDAFLEATITLD